MKVEILICKYACVSSAYVMKLGYVQYLCPSSEDLRFEAFIYMLLFEYMCAPLYVSAIYVPPIVQIV